MEILFDGVKRYFALMGSLVAKEMNSVLIIYLVQFFNLDNKTIFHGTKRPPKSHPSLQLSIPLSKINRRHGFLRIKKSDKIREGRIAQEKEIDFVSELRNLTLSLSTFSWVLNSKINRRSFNSCVLLTTHPFPGRCDCDP